MYLTELRHPCSWRVVSLRSQSAPPDLQEEEVPRVALQLFRRVGRLTWPPGWPLGEGRKDDQRPIVRRDWGAPKPWHLGDYDSTPPGTAPPLSRTHRPADDCAAPASCSSQGRC
jgi:hypothetical protein